MRIFEEQVAELKVKQEAIDMFKRKVRTSISQQQIDQFMQNVENAKSQHKKSHHYALVKEAIHENVIEEKRNKKSVVKNFETSLIIKKR
jgi:6-phosphofructokinase